MFCFFRTVMRQLYYKRLSNVSLYAPYNFFVSQISLIYSYLSKKCHVYSLQQLILLPISSSSSSSSLSFSSSSSPLLHLCLLLLPFSSASSSPSPSPSRPPPPSFLFLLLLVFCNTDLISFCWLFWCSKYYLLYSIPMWCVFSYLMYWQHHTSTVVNVNWQFYIKHIESKENKEYILHQNT